MPELDPVVAKGRSPIAVVLIDYEGTLNDTQASGRLYARDLAAFMASRYPGRRADWTGAVVAAMGVMRQMQEEQATDAWQGYADYRRRELRAWAKTLFEHAGVAADEEDQLDEFIAEVSAAVVPKYIPTPGATSCLESLSETGLRLYVTSGANSEYTSLCLRNAGLAGHFAAIIGPDRVAALKNGPSFYERCLEVAAAPPGLACVVDDSLGPLQWAVGLGCVAVGLGVAASSLPAGSRCFSISRLDELPGLLSIL